MAPLYIPRACAHWVDWVSGQYSSNERKLLLCSEGVNMPEEWRSVVGWEGYYEVSDQGRVRSVDRYIVDSKGKTYFRRGVTLRPGKNSVVEADSYLFVALCRNGKYTQKLVHILVAEAFIPNPDNKPTVNHKDGNKHRNCIDNLEWATYHENNMHAVRTGLRHNYVRDDAWRDMHRRVCRKPVRCIETGESYPYMQYAEKALGLGSTVVGQAVRSGKATHGLHFELISPEEYYATHPFQR